MLNEIKARFDISLTAFDVVSQDDLFCSEVGDRDTEQSNNSNAIAGISKTWPGLLRRRMGLLVRLDCGTVPPEGENMFAPCRSLILRTDDAHRHAQHSLRIL